MFMEHIQIFSEQFELVILQIHGCFLSFSFENRKPLRRQGRLQILLQMNDDFAQVYDVLEEEVPRELLEEFNSNWYCVH